MISLRHIEKTYEMGLTQVIALHDVNTDIARGDLVAIVGPSGSGKSTLLSIVGCVTGPTAGEYSLDGRAVSSLLDTELARIRNRCIGFVFQAFHLLPDLTAVENVGLPLVYRGLSKSERAAAAYDALARVNLQDKGKAKPHQLSGGEQQRVALARAIVGGPDLILADEPTGNLDTKSAGEVLGLLLGLNESGVTIVIVTHNESVWRRCRRVLSLADGCLMEDTEAWGARDVCEERG